MRCQPPLDVGFFSHYGTRGDGVKELCAEAGKTARGEVRLFTCRLLAGTGAGQAIDVRRRAYAEFGFDLGATVSDEFDDRAWHLLATTDKGEAAAALRLIDSASRPFEVERFLSLDPHLVGIRNPAEITRLCVLAPFRGLSGEPTVHVALLRAVFRLAQSLGVSDFIASTRSDLAAFYRYLLFETYPSVTYRHPDIGFEVHTLMRLDLSSIAERYRALRPALFDLIAEALPDPS